MIHDSRNHYQAEQKWKPSMRTDIELSGSEQIATESCDLSTEEQIECAGHADYYSSDKSC